MGMPRSGDVSPLRGKNRACNRARLKPTSNAGGSLAISTRWPRSSTSWHPTCGVWPGIWCATPQPQRTWCRRRSSKCSCMPGGSVPGAVSTTTPPSGIRRATTTNIGGCGKENGVENHDGIVVVDQQTSALRRCRARWRRGPGNRRTRAVLRGCRPEVARDAFATRLGRDRRNGRLPPRRPHPAQARSRGGARLRTPDLPQRVHDPSPERNSPTRCRPKAAFTAWAKSAERKGLARAAANPASR